MYASRLLPGALPLDHGDPVRPQPGDSGHGLHHLEPHGVVSAAVADHQRSSELGENLPCNHHAAGILHRIGGALVVVGGLGAAAVAQGAVLG